MCMPKRCILIKPALILSGIYIILAHFFGVNSVWAQATVPYTNFLTTVTVGNQDAIRLHRLDHNTGQLTTIQTYVGARFAAPPAVNRPPNKMIGGSQSMGGKLALQHYNWGNNSNFILDSNTGSLIGQSINLGFISESIPAGFLSPWMDTLLLSIHRPSDPNGLPMGFNAVIDVFDTITGNLLGTLPTPISFVSIRDHSLTWNGLNGDIFFRDTSSLKRYNVFSNAITSVHPATNAYYPAIPQVDALTGNVIAIDSDQGALRVQEYDPQNPNNSPVNHYTIPSGGAIFGNVASIKGDEYKFLESAGGTVQLQVINIRNNQLSFSIQVPPSIYGGGDLKFMD